MLLGALSLDNEVGGDEDRSDREKSSPHSSQRTILCDFE
jgi:hypothetical protein